MRKTIPILALLAVLLMAGCSSNQEPSAPQATSPANPAVEATAAPSSQVALPPTMDQTRADTRGPISVEVTPLNIANPGATLDFEVALNTHSVDLSMDLASLSTLSTDSGLSVGAMAWDAPNSGHHVSGILSFPAVVDGKPLLEGASQLSLSVRDVGLPERTFGWTLAR